MAFFSFFPDIQYRFGNEQNPDVFPDISVYADVIDEIKNNIAFYYDYTIQDNERPDQLSVKIYDTPDYHWTFFLLNDHIRERGWPLGNRQVVLKAQRDYPYTTLTTRSSLTDKFKVGQTITGNTSGATGTIDHRHLDLGQIVIRRQSGNFIAGEVVTSLNGNNTVESLTIVSSGFEYLAAHHYEDTSGEWVDIDPAVGPGAELVEITYLDRLVEMNEELKNIRIIKPSAILQITRSFREAVRS